VTKATIAIMHNTSTMTMARLVHRANSIARASKGRGIRVEAMMDGGDRDGSAGNDGTSPRMDFKYLLRTGRREL
jgi:hypothetical protein